MIHPLSGKSRRELSYIAASVAMVYEMLLLRRVGPAKAIVYSSSLVRWWS